MRLLALTSLVLALFLALAIALFRAQPPSTHIAGFATCASPCWQGVEPGVTGREEALTLLQAANGLQPFESPCLSPPANFCDSYRWQVTADSAAFLEMDVAGKQIKTLTAYSPGFTLGEALLTLNALHISLDGTYPGYEANHKFYAQLLFADSRLIVRIEAPCPGTIFTLMQAPISTVELQARGLNVQYVPVTTFTAVRQEFYQVCVQA